MGSNQPTTIMSANMNMTVTIFGFVLSAVFMFVICCRLLCFRFRQANTLELLQAARRSAPDDRTMRTLQGLEPSAVASFPTIKYNQQIFISSEDNLCTICLGDYKEKEVLRVLPRCGHAFHVICIDVWLHQHPTCPVCRISLQMFPEWRRLSCPLISLSAKPRFVPGALPDNMFEQPSGFQSMPIAVPTGLCKESLSHTNSSRPVTVGSAIGLSKESLCYLNPGKTLTAGKKSVVEIAESSLSRVQVTEEALEVDREKPGIFFGRLLDGKETVSVDNIHTKDNAVTDTGTSKRQDLDTA